MKKRLPVLLFLAAIVLAYLGGLLSPDVEFVFDDIRFVEDNVAIRDLGRLTDYFTDLKTVDPDAWGGIYRPLRTLDFAIDWNLTATLGTRGKVFWFHLRSLAYHFLSVILLWMLFRRWGAGDVAATLGALVFALHPVQVESVAWITSRADVLYLFLFMAALWFHGASGGFDRRFVAATGLLALALLAKESAVVFVGAAVLTDFFFRDERNVRATLRRWPMYATYTVLAVAYFFVWKHLHDQLDHPWWHMPDRWGGSIVGTLLTMSRGFVYYARLILVPVDMAQDWYLLQVTSPDLLTIACAVLIAAVSILAVVRAFRTGGWFAFAVLWFFITIFPASNLPAPVGIPTAERFLYLPMVGVCVGLGVLLARFWTAGIAPRVAVVVILACLGAVSHSRTEVWTTNKSLWLTTLARFDSPRALDWVGKRDRIRGERALARSRALADQDRVEEASEMAKLSRELFEAALASYDREREIWSLLPSPEGPVGLTHAQRSICLSGLGRYQEALEEAELALAIWPDNYRVLGARAQALFGHGRFREAAEDIERAIKIHDNRRDRENAAAIYEKLAMQYSQAGNKPQAYLALLNSWDHLPDAEKNAAVHLSWKTAEEDFRRLKEPFERRVDRDDQDWGAWLELANVYASYGFYDQAGQIYHRLLGSKNPREGDPAVLYPYARLFWQTRDTEEGYRRAAELYSAILRVDPAHAEALGDLDTCRRALDQILRRRGSK